jgi:glycosyltransferase involved in cell wall biosynthesis
MRICIPGQPTSIGGPESFKRKLAKGLNDAGVQVTFDKNDYPYDAVLVVAVTRDFKWLFQCKRRGIPIIHRLDGFHWYSRTLGLASKRRWHENILNRMMRVIHDHFADYVVYQSQFIADWWSREHGASRAPFTVIHNGVDTDVFSPGAGSSTQGNGISLVSVEGSYAVHDLVFRIPIETWRLVNSVNGSTRLQMLGHVPGPFLSLAPQDSSIDIRTVSNAELPDYLRAATAYVSAEINPPCPNAVIEALACGTPVVGFNTGSLSELVPENAGICVEYGGDPWKLDEPNMDALADAALKVASDYERYSSGARQAALERYSLQDMVSKYIEVFETAVSSSHRKRRAESAVS